MILFWSSSTLLGSLSPCLSEGEKCKKKKLKSVANESTVCRMCLKNMKPCLQENNEVGENVWKEFSPVTMAKAAMQEKAEMSMFMLCKLEENSTMASIHSPKPRTHCNLCSTAPLQKMSLPSAGLDLELIKKKSEKKDKN